MPRARAALYLYFFLLGLSFAVWASRIPEFKHDLRLSDGTLGVALLAIPIGTIAAMPLCGWLTDRYGSANVTRLAGVVLGVTMVGPGLAADLAALMAALLAFGVAMSLLDIAMNAHAVHVEAAYGRPLMSSFHASFSVAGLAGAVIGGQSAGLGIAPLVMFVGTAVPVAVASWFSGGALLPDGRSRTRAPEPDEGEPAAGAAAAAATAPVGEVAPMEVAAGEVATGGLAAGEVAAGKATRSPGARRLTTGVLLLGLLGLCGALGEGVAGDWSAVYLRDELGSSLRFAPAAFAAFSLAMAAGRLAGDWLAVRLGPVRLVRGCGLLASVGLGGALIGHHPVAAVIGFGVMGAGLSCVIPQLFAAAGRADPDRAGRAISLVAGVSYTGFLGGPAVIGALAEWVGLRVALTIPVLLTLLIAACAGALARGR